jgi:hypothetical protein
MSQTMHTAAAGEKQRRAAWATFSPYLTETQLIEAMWLLQASYNQDDMATLIAYVNDLAERFGLNHRRKELYTQYFRHLKQDAAALPPDPWPRMLESRRKVSPAPAVSAEAPPLPVPAGTASAVTEEEKPAVSSELSPPMRVFTVFTATILEAVEHQCAMKQEDLLDGFGEFLKGEALSAPALAEARAWAKDPRPESWTHPLETAELAKIAHVLYVALCDAVGPMAADEILTHAVETAAKLPESRVFSPRQLL